MDKNSFRPILINTLKLILTVIVIYFVWEKVASYWDEIKLYQWDLHYGYLILSIVTGLLTFFMLSSLWRSIIASFSHRLSYFKSFYIFYLSNLGRYVPGKIWQLLGILYLTKQEGIPPERASASFVAVQMFGITASFFVFVVIAFFNPDRLIETIPILGKIPPLYMFAAVSILSCFIILWPGKLFDVGNYFAKKMNRSNIHFDISRLEALKLFLLYSIAWTVYGVGFWFSILAITGDSSVSMLATIGIFNAAYQIGYLALFAPGGIGPRELVLSVMLEPLVGPIAVVLAVTGRLWAILIESIAALLALSIRGNLSK